MLRHLPSWRAEKSDEQNREWIIIRNRNLALNHIIPYLTGTVTLRQGSCRGREIDGAPTLCAAVLMDPSAADAQADRFT